MADDFDVESFPDEFTIVRTGDDFTVQQWPDEFILVGSSDDWSIYTPVEGEWIAEYQAVSLNDAAIAVAARNAALAAQAQADADVVLTHADVVLTHADVVSTHADVVLTHADVVSTHADVVQTGLDKTATAADRVQTGLDRAQTGADRAQTGADRVQTGLDAAATAADRVQTGLDRTQTGTDVANITAMIADMAGGATGEVLVKQSNADYDFTWGSSAGGMSPLVYDPTNVHADAFDRANHHGTQLAATISDFSTAADARISAAIGVTVQAYSAILAGTTASYTVALNTKLGGIATGADVTVSALAPAIHGAASKVTPVDADELALADSAAAFGLKKLTWANLKAAVYAYFIAANKGAIVDADSVLINDSAAGNTPKYTTWTQIKAFLKTYFDTLYGALSAANSWLARNVFVGGATGNSGMATTTGSLGEIEVRGNGTGAAMMAFHRVGSFAAYLGIDTDNQLKFGGWSAGANAYKVWHANNDGAGSGLDADLLDGLNADATSAGNTVTVRDASGDVVARLHRTEWTGQGWNGSFFVGMNANGGVGADNYMRPATPAQAMRAIVNAGFESAQQTVTVAGSLTIAHGLGVKPKLVAIVLQCVTAENGFNIGDEVVFGPGIDAGSGAGISVVPDATNLNVRFGNSNTLRMINQSTGAGVNATVSRWRAVFRAWN